MTTPTTTPVVHHGDCLDILATLPTASIDAVITDPPYGIGFMGKEWDTGKAFVERRNDTTHRFDHVGGNHNPADSADQQRTRQRENNRYGAWCTAWATECLRVLKPGGHLLAFGGTRTSHRLTAGIEDAGFEIRDAITWLYGQGFPKSHDVSKAIDKAAGVEREVIGEHHRHGGGTAASTSMAGPLGTAAVLPLTAPATDAARRWHGWGTALKPASEPIIVARKPLAGTVAGNVLEHGTGALNIDATRTVAPDEHLVRPAVHRHDNDIYARGLGAGVQTNPPGRWPTNVVLSHAGTPDGADLCTTDCVPGCPVVELDTQAGPLASGANPTRRTTDKFRNTYGEFTGQQQITPARGADNGGASRFFPAFRYQAKATGRERPRVDGVAHPTVKPLALMQWLIRLVCPPGAVLLDPFAGSGTTLHAAALEHVHAIGIERDPLYLPLIDARLRQAGIL